MPTTGSKAARPQCEYIDIKGGTAEVPTNTEITLKFTGAISEEEIKKVTIQNDVTGEIAGLCSDGLLWGHHMGSNMQRPTRRIRLHRTCTGGDYG